jgi:hypothetical protein
MLLELSETLALKWFAATETNAKNDAFNARMPSHTLHQQTHPLSIRVAGKRRMCTHSHYTDTRMYEYFLRCLIPAGMFHFYQQVDRGSREFPRSLSKCRVGTASSLQLYASHADLLMLMSKLNLTAVNTNLKL